MKLRIIIQTNDVGHAVHIGGAIRETIKSFDIDAPEVVEFLNDQGDYVYKNILGVEVVEVSSMALKGQLHDRSHQ